MKKLMYNFDGEYASWCYQINDGEWADTYYCTNNSGEGIFRVDSLKNDRKQLVGTCAFSLVGIKDKRAKIRRVMKIQEECGDSLLRKYIKEE